MTKSDRKLESLARCIGRLIETRDPHEGDRLLLDAVFTLEAAGAAAIWRKVDLPPGTLTWRSILERGACESLPAPGLVEAILEGALSSDCLPNRRAVLRAGSDASGIALVLAEVQDPDDRLDALEALLHVRRALAGVGIPLEEFELPPPHPRERADEDPD